MTARTTPWTALLDVLFDDPSVGRCLVAPDGTILRANSEWLRSTGLRIEDAIGADAIALFPEGRDAALALHARARAGHMVQVPRYARRIDGRETWWEGSVAPIPMEGGTGLLVTARDAAARTALDDLRESEDRFRAVFESAFDAVFLSDPSGEGRVLMANPAACRMFGYTEEELRGVTRARILDASDPNLSPFLAARREGRHAGPVELTYLRKDGTRFTGELTSSTFETPAGESRSVAIIRDVTDRKRAADAVALSEAVLAQAGAMARLGAWWIDVTSSPDDLNASPLRWSDEVFRIFGYEPGGVAVSNELFFRHVHPDDRAGVSEAVARAVANRDRYVVEHRILRRDGEERVVLEHGEGYYDAAGRLVRLVGAVQDITLRKRREEALRRAEEHYRTLAENTPEVIARFDRALRHTFVNEYGARVYGLPARRVIGKTNAELGLSPDTVAFLTQHFEEVFATGEQRTVDFEFESPTFGRQLFSSLFVPERDESGAVASILAITRDVTAARRAEEALRSSEARLRRLYDSGMIGVLEFDLAGAIVEANDAFLSMVGYTRADLEEGRIAWDRMTPPEYAPLDAHAIEELTTRGVDTPYEKEYVRKDGTRVPILIGAARFDDARHRGIAFVLNVTERRRAAEALREGEERYRTLFTNMTEGFALGEAICDDAGVPRDFRLVEMNEAFERQSGLDRERARGRPIREVLPFIEQSWIDTYGAIARGAPARRFESYNRDLDRHFSVYCFSPARGRFAIIFTDVTERKRAEESVRAANEKLREADRRKDEFLGMLSHELRNPLAPIRNALYILDRAEPMGQQARRAKDVANRQVAHLTRLVDDLLDVTRIARGKIELRRADLDLAALARRTAEDYRALMQDRGLDLAVEVPDAPLVVNGDDTRLAQVLGNLLSNAAKFTPAGGRVSLSMHARDGRVFVHVRDTGPGIAPDVLPTIFEPFTQAKQTLARSEGGLGLGLALVRGLVALHGGEVTVASAGRGGTEFVVTLPLAARPTAAAERSPATVGAAAAPRRVLVVDDNADAADTLAQLVQLHGHVVEVAYDGPTALEAARARPPDLVLCDLGLPGMDGYEVARRLRAAFPALRLVAVSGYAQPEDVERAAAAGFDGHVAKPPDPERLASLLG